MYTQKLPIREASSAVFLETYVLQNSPEFQTDTRRPAVVICPGGGYLGTSDREAEPVALRFLAQGYHAFVLRYSVQTRFPQPMHDLAKAMHLLKANAAEWLLDSDQITVCGFSAGGHLAAALGVWWHEPWLSEPLGVTAAAIRPHALILGYPAIDLELITNAPMVFEPQVGPVGARDHVLATVMGAPDQALKDRYRLDRHVSSVMPPTFIWHTADDALVPALNALRLATALAAHQVPYELHVFGSGVHGLSLADETTAAEAQHINPHAQIWIELALKWLKQQTLR
jgi:acetyl esterase/lipase